MKRILFAAGSSGGHIYPAIATALALRNIGEDFRFLFVGTRYDLDAELYRKAGVDFTIIPSRRFLLKGIVNNFIKAYSLIRQFQANVIVGFGGFVSFLIMSAGRLQGIPCIVHEQNVIPGLANRLSFFLANKVTLSFSESLRFVYRRRKVVRCLGNPIRRRLASYERSVLYKKYNLDPKRFTLFLMGGSQGSGVLNRIFLDMIKQAQTSIQDSIQVLHITGQDDFEIVKKRYRSFSIPNIVFSYTENIYELFELADLVISRAGALTISELCYFGKPSILIPHPSRRIHQFENASFMERHKAAILLRQEALTPRLLFQKIIELMNNRESLSKMARNARLLCLEDADIALAKEIVETLDVVRN